MICPYAHTHIHTHTHIYNPHTHVYTHLPLHNSAAFLCPHTSSLSPIHAASTHDISADAQGATSVVLACCHNSSI